MSPTVLDVRDLTVRHGGLVALDGVSLQVHAGQIVGLIGPNGAGKTTFIDTITGFTAAHRGHVSFDDRPITGARPHERARAGLARTFQSLELFDDLTVRDNLLVAGHTPTMWSTITDLLWPKSHESTETHCILELLDLLPVADRLPTELSNGQRHVVALGRALVSSPKLVLLDEPAAGLDPTETAALAEMLRRLPATGTTVLVVDHDMSLIMSVCDEVHVLDFGRLVASGTPAEVRSDPVVIAAYLGRPPAHAVDHEPGDEPGHPPTPEPGEVPDDDTVGSHHDSGASHADTDLPGQDDEASHHDHDADGPLHDTDPSHHDTDGSHHDTDGSHHDTGPSQHDTGPSQHDTDASQHDIDGRRHDNDLDVPQHDSGSPHGDGEGSQP